VTRMPSLAGRIEPLVERIGAAQALVGLGVVTAVPTAVTGLSDWADTEGETRRIGLVHAAVNSVGLLCYALSWLSRRRGIGVDVNAFAADVPDGAVVRGPA
jgi:hypothetical protein